MFVDSRVRSFHLLANHKTNINMSGSVGFSAEIEVASCMTSKNCVVNACIFGGMPHSLFIFSAKYFHVPSECSHKWTTLVIPNFSSVGVIFLSGTLSMYVCKMGQKI